ncbi:hypothetical protein PIB30_098805, partial [Stylosanthes scabra]|nr:hypothetical protein [Stylosanthes scabra]
LCWDSVEEPCKRSGNSMFGWAVEIIYWVLISIHSWRHNIHMIFWKGSEAGAVEEEATAAAGGGAWGS